VLWHLQLFQQPCANGHLFVLLVILKHHPTFQVNVTAVKPHRHDYKQKNFHVEKYFYLNAASHFHKGMQK
jgi:hypothetical protein